jgi:putative Ca2+/H+ antiporter (TMEM165/GDT1 family)
LLANTQAILIGDGVADKLSVRAIRVAAAVVFTVLGLFTLLKGDG